MLRVNLLPPYIYDARKKQMWMVANGALLAAVIALFAVLYVNAIGQYDVAKKRLDTANELQTQYNDLDQQINDTNNKIADTKTKQKFVADSQEYNKSWPRVYRSMASVTSPNILLESLAVSSNNHHELIANGFCPDEIKLARWWMDLRNETEMFDSVFITLPPHPFQPASNNTAGGFGFGGGQMGGGYPGMPGGGRGFGGMSGGFPGAPGGMGSFQGGGPGGFGSRGGRGMPGMAGMGGMAGMAGMGGFGGGGRGMGGGGNNGQASATEIEGRRGINFVATLLLKDKLAPPIAVPTWPATAGAGAAGMAGFGGGRMGMMGGMPGMPGGMPGGIPGAPPAGSAGAAAPPDDGGGDASLPKRGRRGKDE